MWGWVEFSIIFMITFHLTLFFFCLGTNEVMRMIIARSLLTES